MYLHVFTKILAYIPGIPQVILSLRILWTPKTVRYGKFRIIPIIHASFHPGQAMKELTRVNATITIIQQVKEFLCWVVVSTHLKNISQIGSFPQVRWKMKNV